MASPPRWRRRLFERLFDHRPLVLLAAALLAAAGAGVGAGLPWREDVMDLLPAQDPLIAQYQRILADFGQLDLMLVVVGPPEGAPPLAAEEILDTADRLEETMRRSGLFRSITYRLDAGDFTSALDVLRAHRAGLFSPDDEAALADRLAPGAVRATLAGWKRQLTESPAPYLAQALARDPLGLDGQLLEKLQTAQSFDGPVRVERGRLVSRDGRHMLLLAHPEVPTTDSRRSQDLVAFMDRATAQAEARTWPRARVAYLSGHRFSIENASRIKDDVKLTMTVSCAAIALVSLAVYRRPLWVGLTFLPTFFGGVFALGGLRLLAPDVSAIAVGCGSMLLGVAVDLGIHILYHIDQITDDRPRREQIIDILDRLFWPLVLCSATTIAAFLALAWSILPGYRSLGHFAVLGFTGATLFAMFVLPLLVPLRSRKAARPPLVPVARSFPAFFTWSARHRPLVLGLLIVSLAASVSGLARLGVEGDYQQMNAVSPRVRSDWDLVNAVVGSGTPSTSIAVQAGDLERSLAANERLYALLKDLQHRGSVASVQSVAPLLPSRATQEQARRRWREFWSPDRVAALGAALDGGTTELRMRPGSFAPFLASLQAPSPPLAVGDLQEGLVGDFLDRHVAAEAPGAPVLTNLELAPGADAEAVFGAVRAVGIPFASFHAPQILAHVAGLIRADMIRVSLITMALVVLILAGYYRAGRELALVLLPLALGLAWTFGIMGWAGLRINLMNSLIVVFVFGVVVDYSIFLATALAGSRGPTDSHLANASVGITVSGLTTMIGLGVLIAARHPALHSIGVTSLLGIGTGLVAVFTVVPLVRPAGALRAAEAATFEPAVETARGPA